MSDNLRLEIDDLKKKVEELDNKHFKLHMLWCKERVFGWPLWKRLAGRGLDPIQEELIVLRTTLNDILKDHDERMKAYPNAEGNPHRLLVMQRGRDALDGSVYEPVCECGGVATEHCPKCSEETK